MSTIIIAGGWDGGSSAGFLEGLLLIVSMIMAFLPLASFAGFYQHGWLAVVQLPVILMCMALLTVRFRRTGARRPVLKLFATYIVLCVLTNTLAVATRIDHSNDFPLTSRLMQLPSTFTASDTIATFGRPIADLIVSLEARPISRTLHSALESLHADSARVLSYDEISPWQDYTLCYVIFDRQTGRLLSVARFYAQPHQDRRPPSWEPL